MNPGMNRYSVCQWIPCIYFHLKTITTINLLHPNITMYILHTVIYTFPMLLTIRMFDSQALQAIHTPRWREAKKEYMFSPRTNQNDSDSAWTKAQTSSEARQLSDLCESGSGIRNGFPKLKKNCLVQEHSDKKAMQI